MDATDPIAARNRSYRIRLERGERVRFLSEVQRYGKTVARPGDTGVVLSESNAGFRGIEASIRTDAGADVYNVSTGLLDWA